MSVKSRLAIVCLVSAVLSDAGAVRHSDFGRLVDGSVVVAPTRLRIVSEDGSAFVYGESRLTTNDYISAGWKLVVDERPAPSSSNKTVYATGWSETENCIVRKYSEADVARPVKAPRKFSKLKLYGAIAQLGAWEKVQAWLETKDVNGVNGWKAFMLAQEVSEDNEIFASLSEEARELIGLSESEFGELLGKCLLEEAH